MFPINSADLRELGSTTAKGGFRNEDDIVRKFNNWKTDKGAQEWLKIMGYDLKEIERVVAIKLHGYKTDVQVQITIFMKQAISVENLSVKLVSNPQGFNQVDKRKVDDYKALWNMPDDIVRLLKLFTGETIPSKPNLRDPRRMFFDEMTTTDRDKIFDFFKEKKILVISDILRGRGDFTAGWMLVALKTTAIAKWVLKNINEAMQIFGKGDVRFTDRGSMKIGRITMQRKGGTPDPTKLQFKINPVDLFDN
jgi:hypothetical protein